MKLDSQSILNTITELIKPVSYISFDNKIKLIDKTIQQSKEQKYVTAYLYKNLVLNLIGAYTNLEVKEEDFDILSETKLLDIILSTFESEYKICSNLMQMCLKDTEAKDGFH